MIPIVLLISVFLFAIITSRAESENPYRLKPTLEIDCIPCCAVLFLFTALLFVSERFFFSAILSIAGTVLLFTINRLKLKQFHEPILFVDFKLLKQIFRYPKFYLPYITPFPIPLVIGCVLFALGVLFFFEPAATESQQGFIIFLYRVTLTLLVAVVILFSGLGRRFILGRIEKRLSCHPQRDLKKLGLTGSLFLQVLQHYHGGEHVDQIISKKHLGTEDSTTTVEGRLPHVVLVQAESFFDARRFGDQIDPHIYTQYDRIGRGGISGQFSVATYGAYTMRTEFTVLTAIDICELGTYGFDPYVIAAEKEIWSVAHYYKKLGYKTICIHPSTMSFFARNKVMVNLGFDYLFGDESFVDAERFGPYVSDAALTDFILQELDIAEQPLFVFAISMEAHGPWESKGYPELQKDLPEIPSWGDEGLAIYLRHLQNSDKMIGRLGDYTHPERPYLFALYGDHIGSLPNAPLKDSEKTDYLIAGSVVGSSECLDMKASELAQMLISVTMKHARVTTDE